MNRDNSRRDDDVDLQDMTDIDAHDLLNETHYDEPLEEDSDLR